MSTTQKLEKNCWLSAKEGRGSFEVQLDHEGNMAIVIRPDVSGPGPEELVAELKVAVGRTYDTLSEMEPVDVVNKVLANATDDEWSGVNRTMAAMQAATGASPKEIAHVLVRTAQPHDESVRQGVEEKLRHISRLVERTAEQLASLDGASSATFSFLWRNQRVVEAAVTTGTETVTFHDPGRD